MKRLQETQRAKIIWNLEHHLQDLREIFQALYGYSDYHSLPELSSSSGSVYEQIENKFAALPTDTSRLTSPKDLVSLAKPLREALESSKSENLSRLEISTWTMFERLINRAEITLNAAGKSVMNLDSRKKVDLYDLAMSALQDVVLDHPGEIHKGQQVLIALEHKVNTAPPRPHHYCSPYDIDLLFYNLFVDAIGATKKGVISLSFDYGTPMTSGTEVTMTISGDVMPKNFQNDSRDSTLKKYRAKMKVKNVQVYRATKHYGARWATQVKIGIPYRT